LLYNQYESYTEVLPLVVLIPGALAAYQLGRLVYRRDAARVRRSARWMKVWLGIAVVADVLMVYLSDGMAHSGAIFAANRFFVALPPMLVAIVAALVLSLPRMRRLTKAAKAVEDTTAPLSPALRSLTTDPWLIVPMNAVWISGLLGFYTDFVARPVPPYTLDAIEANGLMVAWCAVLWWRQTRRQPRLAGPVTPARPGFGVRLWKTTAAVGVVAAVVIGAVALYSDNSVLPASYNMGMSSNMDFGGGPAAPPTAMAMGPGESMAGMNMPTGTPVSQLTGGADTQGVPDEVFNLTAQPKKITLSSGRVVDAWTFNGTVPGPELVVHTGDLVQVNLLNHIPGIGVTLHWHGLNVPNAEDGVPGVTQNAVQTGQRFTYTFRVHQTGTFWYHSHQDAFTEVDRGLYGAFIALPKTPPSNTVDIPVLTHNWNILNNAVTFGIADVLSREAVPAGRRVRLRIINTGTFEPDDTHSPTYILTGSTFQVAAIDGTDLHQPGDLPSGTRVKIGSGGRTDLTFTMPDHPVRLTFTDDPTNGLVLSPTGTGSAPSPSLSGPVFDPTNYGTPTATPFTATSHFDRNFQLILDDGPGFYNGGFEFRLTINGRVYPDTPMLMVKEGDLVRETIVDRGHQSHPFHLHGHTALVLSHNGTAVTGSPWWTDTLEITPGDAYVIAFKADNPGIWMDHCHNLQHANKGMIMHLGYEGVTEPYLTGPATGNQPE
jgi:FtsP/CotA-like multicopper oxidase with cupredoxin domain